MEKKNDRNSHTCDAPSGCHSNTRCQIEKNSSSKNKNSPDHDDGTSRSTTREWTRTLAGKLYEERRSVDGGEGMDLLWETYERESMKLKSKSRPEINSSSNHHHHKKLNEMGVKDRVGHDQVCWSNALKWNARNVNFLRFGRPNLERISMAIKEFRWFGHLRKKQQRLHRNSKKVHDNAKFASGVLNLFL
ncbi:uncharacterized protein LOC127251522 [Andrographis paniculata]|uniref:uncharacterized protein LOC127251522 n=1 Tax=Andrographis paniculata TaxID=175694 RepID=UPI0021E7925B|nr:uncharacterized protein LOC127251522 [Andrographis paniculata]